MLVWSAGVHANAISSADKLPLLAYVIIGIGCFVVVSMLAILVSTTALCRRYYVRREMMNNFKVRDERGGYGEERDGMGRRGAGIGRRGMVWGGEGWYGEERVGMGRRGMVLGGEGRVWGGEGGMGRRGVVWGGEGWYGEERDGMGRRGVREGCCGEEVKAYWSCTCTNQYGYSHSPFISLPPSFLPHPPPPPPHLSSIANRRGTPTPCSLVDRGGTTVVPSSSRWMTGKFPPAM